jgi:hypothetical protein
MRSGRQFVVNGRMVLLLLNVMVGQLDYTMHATSISSSSINFKHWASKRNSVCWQVLSWCSAQLAAAVCTETSALQQRMACCTHDYIAALLSLHTYTAGRASPT